MRDVDSDPIELVSKEISSRSLQAPRMSVGLRQESFAFHWPSHECRLSSIPHGRARGLQRSNDPGAVALAALRPRV
jgi:hypothetical protein